MFQKLGLTKPWASDKDLGRFDVTHADSDKLVFSVPGLRNIAKTGPYFHDGSIATLAEAITLMGRHQLGRELSPADVDAIVTWLNTLTGEAPAAYITEPPMPASGPTTPAPDPT